MATSIRFEISSTNDGFVGQMPYLLGCRKATGKSIEEVLDDAREAILDPVASATG